MWSHLLVDGTETAEFQYVRYVPKPPMDASIKPSRTSTNPSPSGVGIDPSYADDIYALGKVAPILDLASPAITCGRDAAASGPTTSTADVLAGSEIGFRLSDITASVNPPSHVFHPGPGQAYLARPPDDGTRLEDYAGHDADWFKIDTAGPVDDDNWKLFNKREIRDPKRTPRQTKPSRFPQYNFTIPASTPPGKYLLRIEQFMPTAIYNVTQWYPNCAQINVLGKGGGVPTGFARFPGTYKVDDPGILISEEMAAYPPDARNLSYYAAPGPAVWTG
ncbi:glycosyl hydrolase family 61-domain-containing protein [Xylariaceae sp. FL0016]|nr:glycosyl hydrolase family 61-domain-containing protein [Xylariaceae sp. FL0016]